jgi:drug/metabolite transporter (DMT)-like permease
MMGINDFHVNIQSINGDILCFVSMLFFAFYLALARKNRKDKSIYLYIVPLYYIAGIFCFIVSLFFINPIKAYSLKNILLILGLGIIPTVLGHSILNKSMQVMRSQEVSIINLGQFIFAGIMAYFIFNEVPALVFYIASFFVISGSVLVIKLHGK